METALTRVSRPARVPMTTWSIARSPLASLSAAPQQTPADHRDACTEEQPRNQHQQVGGSQPRCLLRLVRPGPS